MRNDEGVWMTVNVTRLWKLIHHMHEDGGIGVLPRPGAGAQIIKYGMRRHRSAIEGAIREETEVTMDVLVSGVMLYDREGTLANNRRRQVRSAEETEGPADSISKLPSRP